MVDRRGLQRGNLGWGAIRDAARGAVFGAILLCCFTSRLPAQSSETTLSDFYPGLRQIGQQPKPDVLHTQKRVHVTYSGTIILPFANYDIRIPSNRGEFPSENSPGAPVVVKNAWGMYWDGSNHFISPSYPYRELTRNRYFLNVIGEARPVQWPFEEPCRGVVAPASERRQPKPAPVYSSVALQPNHSPATLGIAFPWPPQVSTLMPKKEAESATPKLELEPDEFPTFDARVFTRPISTGR
jgi:hypothetical protein